MSTSTDQPRTLAGSPQGGQFATNPGGGEGPHLTGDSDTTAEALIAYARQLEASGRLVETPSIKEKQSDAPGATGPHLTEKTEGQAE